MSREATGGASYIFICNTVAQAYVFIYPDEGDRVGSFSLVPYH